MNVYDDNKYFIHPFLCHIRKIFISTDALPLYSIVDDGVFVSMIATMMADDYDDVNLYVHIIHTRKSKEFRNVQRGEMMEPRKCRA